MSGGVKGGEAKISAGGGRRQRPAGGRAAVPGAHGRGAELEIGVPRAHCRAVPRLGSAELRLRPGATRFGLAAVPDAYGLGVELEIGVPGGSLSRASRPLIVARSPAWERGAPAPPRRNEAGARRLLPAVFRRFRARRGARRLWSRGRTGDRRSRGSFSRGPRPPIVAGFRARERGRLLRPGATCLGLPPQRGAAFRACFDRWFVL